MNYNLQHYKIPLQVCFLCFFSISLNISAQEESKNSFRFSGQISAWGQYTPDIEKTVWIGGRYLPQINYEHYYPNNNKLDFEVSANIFGDCSIKPFSEFDKDGKIKPYRIWTRFSTSQMEFRAGLQKINFGSAQMLRPLMWFDRIDPRDPLQMTDGVWSGLFRYYFKNNTNIWLWGLTMNKDTKGMELLPTAGDIRPEAGGRVQFPINKGETAFSYHTRKIDVVNYFNENGLSIFFPANPPDLTREHRFGFDIRADVILGLWFETSLTYLTEWINLPVNFSLKNQLMTTIGADYTIGIGNGLGITLEHLHYSFGNKVFDFNENINFTALNLTYPVSLFGNANAILYYDWKNKGLYSFAGFNYQIKEITLYLMGYWNPKINALPMQSGTERFSGKGVQVMAVWNY